MKELAEAERGKWLQTQDAGRFQRLLAERRPAVAAVPPGVAVVAAEKDRVEFFATAVAALLEQRDLLLANPDWGNREWETARKAAGPCWLPDGRLTGRARPGGKKREPRVLIPTGGSSGLLRLTIHTWMTVSASADAFLRFAGVSEIDHVSILPPWHVSGFLPAVRAWRGGGRLIFGKLDDLPTSLPGGAVVSLVPTQLVRLAGQGRWEPLRRARMVLLGGAGAPAGLLDHAAREQVPLVPCYGMTETAALVCALPVAEFLAGRRGAGRPLNHASVAIRDKAGAEVSPGTAGRVWLRTASLFSGYAGEKNPSADSGGWWATGDCGRIDAEGWLTLLGRLDDVIVSGGEKISASALEACLLESGLVREALAAGLPDDQWGERVVCACVPAAGVGTDQLDAWIRGKLSRHFVPKQWILVARIPRNAVGKPDRAALRAMASTG